MRLQDSLLGKKESVQDSEYEEGDVLAKTIESIGEKERRENWQSKKSETFITRNRLIK